MRKKNESIIKCILINFYRVQTDDKGVFFSEASNEYKLAGETFNLTRTELFEISFRSIDAIFNDEVMKSKLKKVWLEWKKEQASEFQLE